MAGRVLSTTAGAIAALSGLLGPVPLSAVVAFFVAFLAAFPAAQVAFPAAALAAEPPASQPSASGSDEATPTPGRPLPPDDRKGHVTAFAGMNLVVPAGDLGAGVTLAQIANTGGAVEGGVAVGLTRYSGLELRGQYVRFGASSSCASCGSEMFAAGLGLTYHTSQALGFDPWVRFSVGYRSLNVTGNLTDIINSAPAAGTYQGIDVASYTLGGDYFPVPWFGIGLFFTGDVGIMVATPDPRARGAVYGLFQAGLRIALEPQRKAVSVVTSTPKRPTTVGQRSDFGPALYNRAVQ